MTRKAGVLPGFEGDAPFVGWGKAPAVDRRFLLASLPLLLGGAGAAAAGLARLADDPGAGAWETGKIFRVRGVLRAAPYPMLHVADAAAPSGVRTVLIVAEGKCTTALKLAGDVGRSVIASGALITRGGRQILEVPITLNTWLEPAAPITLPEIAPQSLGRARLAGRIMDSKCFFGVMRPSLGKTHKSCSALCIRGGVPPSFWARRRDGKEAVLLLTDARGAAQGEEILPLVTDPVEAVGELVRVGDIVQFRADAAAFRRLA